MSVPPACSSNSSLCTTRLRRRPDRATDRPQPATATRFDLTGQDRFLDNAVREELDVHLRRGDLDAKRCDELGRKIQHVFGTKDALLAQWRRTS